MFKIHKLFLAVVFLVAWVAPAQAADFTVNKIAAVVNGEIITLHSLREQARPEMERQGIAENDPRADVLLRGVLDAMISDILLRHDARKYKISVSDAEVDSEIRSIMQNSRLSQAQFEAQLSQRGTNLESFKGQVRDTLLRRRIISMMIARKVVVTEDEIKRYYEANRSQFSGQPYVDFSVIVFRNTADHKSVYDRIKSGSLSFEEAARQFSMDPTAENGGRAGRAPLAALPDGLRTVLAELPEGGLSPVINREGNMLVFKLNEKGTDRALTLQEARPRIEEILKEPRMQERFREYTRQLREKAVVDIRI